MGVGFHEQPMEIDMGSKQGHRENEDTVPLLPGGQK